MALVSGRRLPAAARLARCVARNLFGEHHQRPPDVRIPDLAVGMDQSYRAGSFQKAECGVGVLSRISRAVLGGPEQERYRDAENFRDARQSSRTDPINAFLVLLNLLKGDANARAELGLRHAADQA